MSSLNDILLDESFNDKQLVKELSQLVKNHKDKELSINKKFYMDVIKIILQNDDEDMALKNIQLWEYDKYMLGGYGEGILLLCIDSITHCYNCKKEYFFEGISNKRLYGYYLVISTLVHELTHDKQDMLERKRYTDIYNSSHELVNNYYETYQENHDLVPIERFANLRSTKITLDVLSNVYKEKDLLPFRIAFINELLYGYKLEDEILITPDEKFSNIEDQLDLHKASKDLSEIKDLYDKIYLGIDISIEEYKRIVDLKEEIKTGKKDPTKIKVLINNKNKT